jgi:hypothetical protein
MTLTGRLDTERRESVLTMLRNRFSAIGLTMLAIDSIAVSRQENADSRFQIVDHWKLQIEAVSDPNR